MKKIIAVISIIMVFALLCSCGAGKTSPETTEPEGNSEKMVNPMVESSPEEIKKAVGFSLEVPEEIKDASYYLISGELGQADYMKDGNAYTVRIKRSDEIEDVSGMYYSWTVDKDCKINGCDGFIHICDTDDEKASSIVWFDEEVGVTHSISVNNAVTEAELIAAAEAVA